jgi:DNA-binding GntR family transcriptional regulator
LPLPELTERRTTSDQIADALRDAILTGEFEDGEELNQVALANHFGISRVPIREALRQLQAEGLVSAKAHQRTVVTTLSPERVAEILEIRSLLEAHLLSKTMNKLDPAQIKALEDICDQMDKAGDHQDWLRLNREFHLALYAPAATSFTSGLIEQLSARVERYLHLLSDTGVERNKEANAEHRAIVRAIKAGDKRQARRELESHIGHTKERVVALFAGRSAADAARADVPAPA